MEHGISFVDLNSLPSCLVNDLFAAVKDTDLSIHLLHPLDMACEKMLLKVLNGNKLALAPLLSLNHRLITFLSLL